MDAVTGDKKLDKALQTLKESAAKRAVQKGLTTAAQEGRKLVKAEVPSQYKTVRKSIGWRAIKRSRNKGEPGAKVGAGVGKKSKSKTTQRDRGNRAGVGIDRANIHWWFMGTKGRSTRNGANRGVMPAQMSPVAVILNRNKWALKTVIRKFTWQGFEKEAAKLKK